MSWRNKASARVQFKPVTIDEVGDFATLATVLKAQIVVRPDPDTSSHQVELVWDGMDASNLAMGIVAATAFHNQRSMDGVLEQVTATYLKVGFTPETLVDPKQLLVSSK